jgi:hypothetical protein
LKFFGHLKKPEMQKIINIQIIPLLFQRRDEEYRINHKNKKASEKWMPLQVCVI